MEEKLRPSSVQIVPVASGKKLSQWIRFPYQIYPKGSNWVAPLEADLKHKISPKKNPFLKHGVACPYFALDENGKALGRILAQVDFTHLYSVLEIVRYSKKDSWQKRFMLSSVFLV